MYDPHFIAASSLQQCYRQGGIREFPRDSPEGLRKSLSKLHDVNQHLIRANNELHKALLEQKDQLRWEKTWRWGIVAAVVISILLRILH